MSRQFLPDVHGCVTMNLRNGFKERFGKELTVVDDEVIWAIFDDWSDVVDDEHPDDKEFAMYEQLELAERTGVYQP